jgi:hypothetical protein
MIRALLGGASREQDTLMIGGLRAFGCPPQSAIDQDRANSGIDDSKWKEQCITPTIRNKQPFQEERWLNQKAADHVKNQRQTVAHDNRNHQVRQMSHDERSDYY